MAAVSVWVITMLTLGRILTFQMDEFDRPLTTEAHCRAYAERIYAKGGIATCHRFVTYDQWRKNPKGA